MELNHVPTLIRCTYKARRVPFLWGVAGIGKSEVVAQSARLIAEDLVAEKKIKSVDEFGFIDLRLGTQDVGDLVGIPRGKDIDGEFRTVWGKPEWWPKEGTYGLLFLDEFNRAGTQDVLQAMFQFILGTSDENGKITRNLHTHHLPEGWHIVCAGNPDTKDYVVQAIDSSMLDRFIQIKVDMNKTVAAKWMKTHLHCKEIAAFVKENKDALGKKEKQQFTIEVEPSPRSYTFIDNMMDVMTDKEFDLLGREIICGIIGETVGNHFWTHLKTNILKPLTVDQVMKCEDFEKFATETVARYLSKEKSQLNLIDTTLTDIVESIKNETKYTPAEYANLIMFLNIIPKDMMLTFDTALFNTGDPSLPFMEFLADDTDEFAELKRTFMFRGIEAFGFERAEIEQGEIDIKKCVEDYKASIAKDAK